MKVAIDIRLISIEDGKAVIGLQAHKLDGGKLVRSLPLSRPSYPLAVGDSVYLDVNVDEEN